MEAYNLKNPLRLFITTSNFTKEAKIQANTPNKPLIYLMDGSELVDLVIYSDLIPGISWPREEEEDL